MNIGLPVKLTALLLCANVSLFAQDQSTIKFGKINPPDFNVAVPATDSGAHALIISDIGESTVTPNKSGGFGYVFKRHLRVKIIDINGVDAGKFEIPLYSEKNGNGREELDQIKGVTYNLESGKVVASKLAGDQVFTEKTNRTYQEKKFSMPALKAGSIFELSYTILSDFIFDLRPWEFQTQYPCLWSEYNTEIPEYYNYVYLAQGYLPFSIRKKDSQIRNFLIRDSRSAGGSESFTVSGMVNINRWVIKDVPAIKEEMYTTTIDNHRSKIEFQLSSVQYPEQSLQPVMESWAKVTKSYLEHEDFGGQLNRFGGMLDDQLQMIVNDKMTASEKAMRIYSYVRDNYTCTQHGGRYSLAGLKNFIKTKQGNVADFTLLLMALLKREHIECYPVILSTRSHGITNVLYPLIERFNYVVCEAIINDNAVILDASVPGLAFGKLDLECYNGHARVLTEEPQPVFFSADSLLERSMNLAVVMMEDKKMTARITSNPGYYESLHHRSFIKENGETAFFEKIKKYYGSDFEVINTEIDSLQKLEAPIKVVYDLQIKSENEDILYLNPVLIPFYKENPFAALTRRYPVEMPYKIDETFLLTMTLPENYTVDELPKSAKVKLNESEGLFEYLISAEGGMIQLRTRLILTKANFDSEDYDGLRDFFGYVVKKQAEQIVLKKKTN